MLYLSLELKKQTCSSKRACLGRGDLSVISQLLVLLPRAGARIGITQGALQRQSTVCTSKQNSMVLGTIVMHMLCFFCASVPVWTLWFEIDSGGTPPADGKTNVDHVIRA